MHRILMFIFGKPSYGNWITETLGVNPLTSKVFSALHHAGKTRDCKTIDPQTTSGKPTDVYLHRYFFLVARILSMAKQG